MDAAGSTEKPVEVEAGMAFEEIKCHDHREKIQFALVVPSSAYR
jgi:hypothetical protein